MKNDIKKLDAIRAVSFDLDDTFWDCAPAIVKAEETLYVWLEQHYPDIAAKHTREAMPEMRANMYQTHPHLKTDVTMMRKAFLQQLLEDHEHSEQKSEDAFAVFYRARSEVVLYEGTHELLKALKKTHLVTAITNGNADLGQIGLDHYFDDIQRAALDNPPKPASDMFDRCCKNIGIANNELLHVGDNPETDVVGGHLSGALTVWFNQSGEPWPDAFSSPKGCDPNFSGPDFEVSSIPELQALLTS